MGGVTGGKASPSRSTGRWASPTRSRSGVPSPAIHLGDTAFIGVGIADAPRLGGPPGAIVRQVLPDTPASQAGLFGGDLITAVDGIPVNSAADLSNLMDQRRPGDTIMLSWIDRAGNPAPFLWF